MIQLNKNLKMKSKKACICPEFIRIKNIYNIPRKGRKRKIEIGSILFICKKCGYLTDLNQKSNKPGKRVHPESSLSEVFASLSKFKGVEIE